MSPLFLVLLFVSFFWVFFFVFCVFVSLNGSDLMLRRFCVAPLDDECFMIFLPRLVLNAHTHTYTHTITKFISLSFFLS